MCKAALISIEKLQRFVGHTLSKKTKPRESAEQNAETLLYAALENFPSFVIIDRSGKIVYMNENYTKILGITKKDAIGSAVENIIPNTRLPIVMENEKEEIGELMSFFDHGEGKNITLVCNRIPIRKDGKIIGCIGNTTIKDIDIVSNIYEEINIIKLQNKKFKEKINILQSTHNPFEHLVGSSQPLAEVKKQILDYADTNLSILITGETGTGKEPAAKIIHHLSKRFLNNFVKINCAAIPADLLETELFGFVEGAFTGATKGGKTGKYELAHNGTLLLDEIGEMSLDLQAKLLRVLQEGEFEPVGGVQTKRVNVRLICSTNRNLEQLVQEKRFRADLYYRVNVVEIKMPPLKERIEDIEALCEYFIQRVRWETQNNIKKITEKTIQRFAQYNWPGNVRELEHAIKRAAVMCKDGVLSEEHFEFLWTRIKSHSGEELPANLALKHQMGSAEKFALVEALRKASGNKSLAAKMLGIDRSRLYEKLHRHNLV